MNPQSIFADLATNLRRPGVVKSLLGQLAIAYGARMVADVAAEADERIEAANAELERITGETAAAQRILHERLEEFESNVKALIASGVYDAYVMARAAQIGWTLPEPDGGPLPKREPGASLAADGPVAEYSPVETADVAVDVPGEPRPPCHDVRCKLDYGHDGECAPADPPRMAGGYLVSPGATGDSEHAD